MLDEQNFDWSNFVWQHKISKRKFHFAFIHHSKIQGMKKFIIAILLLSYPTMFAQQHKLLLQTNLADYFGIEGKSGEKFYDQVRTINAFDIKLYDEFLNDPKNDIHDWRIARFGTGLCQYKIFENSIVELVPTL